MIQRHHQKFLLSKTLIFVLSIFMAKSVFADMSVDFLLKLSILQKLHHERPYSKESKEFISIYSEVLNSHEIEVTEEWADSYFEQQPKIPFILFKSKKINSTNPAHLIIHTHGGPKVLFRSNIPHAEIAYYVANGFVVACPNYRGSDFPVGHPLYITSKNLTNRELQKTGPKDIYAVAKFLNSKDFIHQNSIILRGGSFGSFINSHLVTLIQKNKFPQIFSGVHLSGGVNYPNASEFPDNFPILITHGTSDMIAPFEDAFELMNNLLSSKKKVQVFVGEGSDHHLVDQQYIQLQKYLEISTNFINNLASGKNLGLQDLIVQLNDIKRFTRGNPNEDYIPVINDKFSDWVNRKTTPSSKESPTMPKRAIDQVDQEVKLGTTLAHMSLVMGKDYTNNIRQDFENFIKYFFRPIDWETRRPIYNIADRMISDKPFLNQMVKVIETEQRIVSQNPEIITYYHAAELSALQLYTFLGLWKSALRGRPLNDLKTLNEFRLWDMVIDSTDNIQDFLMGVRKKNQHFPNNIFNNTPGFADRALSCNVGLTMNRHTTASSSLWWYYNSKDIYQSAPLQETIEELLKDLGIYSGERVQRYLRLFENERKYLERENINQTALIQFFLPYSLANKLSYVSQIWGAEFKNNDINLANPEIFKEFNKNPMTFEETLRRNQSAFENLGDYHDFGKFSNGFFYSDLLQVRFLQSPLQKYEGQIKTKVYFRRKELFKNLVKKLARLINQDYAEYLRGDSIIPNYLVHGAQTATENARLELEHIKETRINDEIYLRIQKELRKGLVQDPNNPEYSETFKNMDRDQKTALQLKLKDVKMESRNLFSLCIYLKGYTYYDILIERLEEGKKKLHAAFPNLPDSVEKKHVRTLKLISRFSKMNSIYTEDISSGQYHEFYNALQSVISETKYDPTKYKFFQPEGPQVYENYLLNAELWTAVNSVRNNAKMAKERGQGHF